jgi:hypothetical protein
LKVSVKNESQSYREYEYNQDLIVIGRDAKSDLQLQAEKSVISRKHTELKFQDDVYKIKDLNSRNFTYLNNKKLEVGKEYTLTNGDNILICDYKIQFFFKKLDPIDLADNKTIIDFPNPFIHNAIELVNVLNRMSEKYEQEDINRKDETFQEALHNAFHNIRSNKTLLFIQNALKEPSKKETTSMVLKKSTREESDISGMEKTKNIIHILVKFLVQMIQARKQFLMEFVGETIIQSKDNSTIDRLDSDEMVKYLFNPEISEQESEHRIQKIKDYIDKLLLHQVSHLDGYKMSIDRGTKQILDKLSPSLLEDRIKKETFSLAGIKIPYRFIPAITFFKVIKKIYTTHKDLISEDKSIVERRYFRPGYIQNYNKRMKSLKKS